VTVRDVRVEQALVAAGAAIAQVGLQIEAVVLRAVAVVVFVVANLGDRRSSSSALHTSSVAGWTGHLYSQPVAGLPSALMKPSSHFVSSSVQVLFWQTPPALACAKMHF
jgi:hypothetical protein